MAGRFGPLVMRVIALLSVKFVGRIQKSSCAFNQNKIRPSLASSNPTVRQPLQDDILGNEELPHCVSEAVLRSTSGGICSEPKSVPSRLAKLANSTVLRIL